MKSIIKKMLKEVDDFDWVRDVQANPWSVYTAVVFDISPNEHNVEKLIRLCLSYHGENINNFYEWTEEEMEIDVENIVDRSYDDERGGYLILGITDRGNLSYTRESDIYDLNTSIHYSRLLKSNILKESNGDDDWGWAREINPDTTVNIDNVYEGMPVKIKTDSIYRYQTEKDEIGYVNFDGGNYPEYEHEYDEEYDEYDEEGYIWVSVIWPKSGSNTYRIGPHRFDLDFVYETIKESEEDDLDWIRDVRPSLKTIGDIEYFLYKHFKLYHPRTGEEDTYTPGIVDNVYWMEPVRTSPKHYNVCWNERHDEAVKKHCVDYLAETLVNNFNDDKDADGWVWKFVD